MQIVVAASDNQWNELTASSTKINWVRVTNAEDFNKHNNADAFFYLLQDEFINNDNTITPIILHAFANPNAVINPTNNIIKIIGWPTFLNRNIWEAEGIINEAATLILSALNKKIIAVKNTQGWVAANIVSMIVNEAYYALQDGVSTKNEIDTAMKLGTNYPYGPFEWSEKIGLQNIATLLQLLAVKDLRYTPCTLLLTEAFNTI
jgi:3-hydroxybutyryl-CoA dehydrogenase